MHHRVSTVWAPGNIFTSCCVVEVARMNIPIRTLKIIPGGKQKKAKKFLVYLLCYYSTRSVVCGLKWTKFISG